VGEHDDELASVIACDLKRLVGPVQHARNQMVPANPFFLTHRIDPEVDGARDYLVEDLLASESLKSLAYVKGVGAAPLQKPRENLAGDLYFTDGLRAVMYFGHASLGRSG
jgi:hypothetical protein